MNITFDTQKTELRKQKLYEYFQEYVLKERKFICKSFAECKESHSDIFYEGQLHHVGSYYDAYISDRPFRTVVVGQEYGHEPSCVSMKDRTSMVLNQTGLQKNFTNRNPHMRGTTSALRLLYGIPLGSDHASEYIQVNSNTKCHIFDTFALVNYLLCSAVAKEKGRRGKSTNTMKSNCQNHFRSALEILEPNVMIVQSKGYWKCITRAFDQITPLSNELYRAKQSKNDIMVAVFAHPSTPDNEHNWGRNEKTSYLLETVYPTIEIIQRELLDQSTQPRFERIEHQSEENSELSRRKPEVAYITSRQQNDITANKQESSGMRIQYDEFYTYMETELLASLPKEVLERKPKFIVKSNRMHIPLDRIAGSHYEICLRMDYHEIALHFQSTTKRNLSRSQVFDLHLDELSQKLGQSVRSGKLENQGWMRVWIELPKQKLTDTLGKFYTDLFGNFIAETYPILFSIYEQEEAER